jgi:hypothetical protein
MGLANGISSTLDVRVIQPLVVTFSASKGGHRMTYYELWFAAKCRRMKALEIQEYLSTHQQFRTCTVILKCKH